jgi:hypothetical protein
MKTQQYKRGQSAGNGKSNKKSNKVISQDTEIQNRKHRRAVREAKESAENTDWTDPRSWAQSYLNIEDDTELTDQERIALYDYDTEEDKNDDASAFTWDPRLQKEV